MSAFYDLASLVLVPSGYKTSKVYAQKPLTTDGQLAFTRSTTATRVNSAGLIETAAVNVPRLDYLNSSCPRLLLEPQRTNSLTYSEQFDNAAWTKSNSSITANAATSPDGYTNADKIVENTATSGHSAFQSISVTSGATYTLSAFGKAAERTRLWLDLFGGTNSANFDLSNGTILASSAGITAKIENYGNGWYRCSITGIAPAATIFPNVGPTTSSTTSNQYTGNGTSGILIYGAQLELGSYVSSYVNTLGAAVTRGADAASKTGISSLIGQTEGTLFYDGFFGNEATEVYLFLQKGASSGVSDSIYLQRDANAIALNVFTATQQSFISGGTFTIGQRVKIAAAYKANDFVLYVNGVQLGTDNTGSVPTCDALQFASYRALPTNAEYINVKGSNQALLFKTRLSNADLAALTA